MDFFRTIFSNLALLKFLLIFFSRGNYENIPQSLSDMFGSLLKPTRKLIQTMKTCHLACVGEGLTPSDPFPQFCKGGCPRAGPRALPRADARTSLRPVCRALAGARLLFFFGIDSRCLFPSKTGIPMGVKARSGPSGTLPN